MRTEHVVFVFIFFVFASNICFLWWHTPITQEHPKTKIIGYQDFIESTEKQPAAVRHGEIFTSVSTLAPETKSLAISTDLSIEMPPKLQESQSDNEKFNKNFQAMQVRASGPQSLQAMFLEVKDHIRNSASRFGSNLDRIFPAETGIPKLGKMFEECYVNTLETTTTVHTTSSISLKSQIMLQELTDEYIEENPFRTHVITGDIEAMWLRDSMGQFRPYLFGAHASTRSQESSQLLAKAAKLANQSPQRTLASLSLQEKRNAQELYQGWLKNSNEMSESSQEAVQAMRIVTEGLIRRQAELIALVDPLANAYRLTIWSRPLKGFEVNQGKGGIIAERKYELDSLCSFLQLTTTLFEQVHPINQEFTCSAQDPLFTDEILLQSLQTVLHVIETLQHPNQPIRFGFNILINSKDSIDLDSCVKHPVKLMEEYSNPELPPKKWQKIPYTGLSASGFRPSDDVCEYPFHIPSNMYAVATLTNIKTMLESILSSNSCFGLASRKQTIINNILEKCDSLRKEIDRGIHQFAVHQHPEFGEIYCYEVDGNGNCALMDDANNPSLLGIPHYQYEGVNQEATRMQELYSNTRDFVLSSSNPYFVPFPKNKQSEFVSGAVGSPHTKTGSVWPMSMIIQATTRLDSLMKVLREHKVDINNSYAHKQLPNPNSNWVKEVRNASQEIQQLLKILQETTAGKGLMHESFQANPFNPSSFTRSWFSWANSLYAESIISSLPLLVPEIFE